ncbi:DUF4432 family protein [Pseudoxanthomonas indica]|uniref:Galactose mutarotase n=1 Tax=Pseudoxanthomonas indica TaxID=428993 RepID=A0A1T5LLX1_9GAMM|nr:DUF4432 family protein [Pseudoxanthomonas indica]GGD36843.1 hypothetical protein GCM10007235_06170 [Pseudoxanthomonas indica]SKC77007.1 protein of unknown function [Pseudoxanthomonas indica]
MSPLVFQQERNSGCRLRQFVYRGHRCVSLENATVRVVIAADKGADIIEFLYKPKDVECLWHSRHGLRDDAHLRLSSPLQGGHFREYFPGGWYEMLPNGPQPCEHRGAAFGHHGEATLLPWDYRIVRDDADGVGVVFSVRLGRIPLRLERAMFLEGEGGTVRLEEQVTNESGQTVEFLWGHHPTFGAPLVEPGARIFLPSGTTASTSDSVPDGSRVAAQARGTWPHLTAQAGAGDVDLSTIPHADAGSHEFVRLDDLIEGWFAIVNPQREVGFALRWDVATFPMVGLWQIWGGGQDYPWYGMPHLLALEPASDLPSLAESVRRGTAITLAGGQSRRTVLEATAFSSRSTVTHVGAGGAITDDAAAGEYA